MIKKIILILFLLTLFVSQNFGEVQKISNYNITIDVDKTPQHIVNKFTIKNLVQYPLVPGIGEIRLQKQGPIKLANLLPIPFTKEETPIKVENLKGYYVLGGSNKKIEMKTYVKEYKTYNIIYYEIWEPVEKDSNITVFIQYNANIVDNGVLFKTLSIPVGGDISIDNLNINYNTKLYQTYQEPKGNNFKIPANSLFIIKSEFSILPLPQLPTYGYMLIWSGVLLILIILFAYFEITRGNKNNKEELNENNKEDNEEDNT